MRTEPALSDLDHLARTARRTLADARQVTLLINGVGRLDPADAALTLHERDGLPTFLCEPGSPVTAAARDGHSALLTVDVADPDGRSVSLLLAGTLSVIGVDLIDGVPIDVVALPPTRVVVECDVPSNPTVAQYEVPAQLYRQTEPGLRPADTMPILQHTNDGHQAELCEYLARLHDAPLASIAGAQMMRLDERGADIHWVETAGAHVTTITFARPASSLRELGNLLRAELLGC